MNVSTSAVASKPATGLHVCGLTVGLPISGRTEMTAVTEETFDPEYRIDAVHGTALAGQVRVRADAVLGLDVEGCEGLTGGGPVEKCNKSFNERPRPDGKKSIGFSVEAPSKDADSATLTWDVPDPEVGFVNATDEACNVSIQQTLAPEQLKQEVPLSQLKGTEPFYLAFQGEKEWDADFLGLPSKIYFKWTYAAKLQRVDADGKPL
jgi:hypothetical protein